LQTNWVDYFSNKRSNKLNIFFAFWISSIFGFVSILSIKETKTVLALLAFLLVTIFLALYFFQEIHLYSVWEKFAIENEQNKIFETYMKSYENLSYPRPKTTREKILYYISPKNSLELGVQFSIWSGFEVILLLWNNSTTQQFLGSVLWLLPYFSWIGDGLHFKFWLRHLIFCILFIVSIGIFVFCLTIDFRRDNKK